MIKKVPDVTTREFGEYGGEVVTHTATQVFPSIDRLQSAVKAAFPLYLKHAFPRTGKVHKLQDGHTVMFHWDNVGDDGGIQRYRRVYRLESHEEMTERTETAVKMASDCGC